MRFCHKDNEWWCCLFFLNGRTSGRPRDNMTRFLNFCVLVDLETWINHEAEAGESRIGSVLQRTECRAA